MVCNDCLFQRNRILLCNWYEIKLTNCYVVRPGQGGIILSEALGDGR